MKENSAQCSQNEIMKKPFFCQNYAIFLTKMVHVVIKKYFSLFPKRFEDFLYR